MNILLLLVIAVTVGAVVFGVMTLVTGGDPGLKPAEPDTRAKPLPSDRPLVEGDIGRVTFDTAWRGYRMDQIDQTLRRLAYDIGYKSELIEVLEAEIAALREGRQEDADALARTRAAALNPKPVVTEPEPVIELVSEVAPETAEQPEEADHETDHVTGAITPASPTKTPASQTKSADASESVS
ncbi:MAG TPA: DivIVA domain-containing protein [Candidatus Limnocylindrales bacterium]|nr:DivIVA domain-containing protein [Candidatus Limnocylindrales bacterium]